MKITIMYDEQHYSKIKLIGKIKTILDEDLYDVPIADDFQELHDSLLLVLRKKLKNNKAIIRTIKFLKGD